MPHGLDANNDFASESLFGLLIKLETLHLHSNNFVDTIASQQGGPDSAVKNPIRYQL